VSAYVALLDGGKREVAVEVTRGEDGTFEVRLGDTVHRVDAFRHDHGTLSLIVDTQSFSVMLDRRDGPAKVRVRDAVFPVEILDERRLRLRRATAPSTGVAGRQPLAFPLPGKVVEVLCRAGDVVKAGQPLVVVAALDMENEVRSPKDGTVVELTAQAGQAVAANTRLGAVE
jgi:biotin carboxyl carrier protein